MTVLPVFMDQNCNLELRLSPDSNHDSGDRHHPRLHRFLDDDSSKNSQQQLMTIFYNGRVCVADFTQDQARAIFMLATRPMEECSPSRGQKWERSSPESCSGEAGSGSGLSMKRSLQRFLQKRKNRIQSASPYHQNNPSHYNL